MKYAVHYRKDFRHFDTVDEVIFDVTKGNESIYLELPNIIKPDWDWQKITLNLAALENPIESVIPHILKLKEIHSNILVQLRYPFVDSEVQLMKDNNIPFMAAYTYCKSLDMVYAMKEYGVSEILVAEGLAFNLSVVRKVLEGTDIKIRIIPNVAQCAVGTKHKVPTIHKFWVRPEDTEFYEPDVDTFEIYNEDDRISVVYEIYKSRVWKGNLKELILDAEDLDVENTALVPYFGSRRIDCKQICMYKGCEVCDACIGFANRFKDTDQEIVYPKRKEKNEHTEND
jgi:hypothetical protein